MDGPPGNIACNTSQQGFAVQCSIRFLYPNCPVFTQIVFLRPYIREHQRKCERLKLGIRECLAIITMDCGPIESFGTSCRDLRELVGPVAHARWARDHAGVGRLG